MDKKRHRILKYPNSDVDRVFEKENQIIQQIQADELEQCLMLWRCEKPSLVLPAGNKWPDSIDLQQSLSEIGWQVYSRRTGGAPVPQTPGLINLSHLYLWPEGTDYSIPVAYQNLCQVLTIFLEGLGVKVDVHATPFSYCDGDYNLNIEKQKIVGTAQRVVLKRGGGKIVLAQACILIDDDLDFLVQPVNLCNQLSGYEDRVKAEVHTCLNQHITELPSTEALFNRLVQAFIDSKLYG